MSNLVSFPKITQSSDALTPRESEVVSLAYLTNAEIGRVLDISKDTVRAHFRSVAIKLGAESRTQAYAIWARRESREMERAA